MNSQDWYGAKPDQSGIREIPDRDVAAIAVRARYGCADPIRLLDDVRYLLARCRRRYAGPHPEQLVEARYRP